MHLLKPFNVMCCVSGLPITHGDRVRAFLLTESPIQSWTTEQRTVDGFWFPRVSPLTGTYSGDGMVTDVAEGPERNLWLKGFTFDLLEHLRWMPPKRVRPSKGMDFDTLILALAQEMVWVHSNGGATYRGIKENPLTRYMHMGRSLPKEVVADSESVSRAEQTRHSELVERKDHLRVRLAFVHERIWKELLGMNVEMHTMSHLRRVVSSSTSLTDQPAAQMAIFTHVDMSRHQEQEGAVSESLLQSTAELLFVRGILEQTPFMWRPSSPLDPSQMSIRVAAKLHNLYARAAWQIDGDASRADPPHVR